MRPIVLDNAIANGGEHAQPKGNKDESFEHFNENEHRFYLSNGLR